VTTPFCCIVPFATAYLFIGTESRQAPIGLVRCWFLSLGRDWVQLAFNRVEPLLQPIKPMIAALAFVIEAIRPFVDRAHQHHDVTELALHLSHLDLQVPQALLHGSHPVAEVGETLARIRPQLAQVLKN